MATLHERHRVKNLDREKKAVGPERAALIDRLIGLGVLEDKALRAVKERGLTDADVDKNLASGLPPHFVEYVDPVILDKLGFKEAAEEARRVLKEARNVQP